MRVLVEGYAHRTGEHCASTALRNILQFNGVDFSEPMILGLASGLGFFYIRNDAMSPSRLFHGRTAQLDEDFGRNTGRPFVERPEPDDARAFEKLCERIDAGQPVMVSTDTYYLRYHNTRSHFPGHRAVVVGYDLEAGQVFLADRKFEAYQACDIEELRHSRNARDYVASCENRYGDFEGEVKLGRPLVEAMRIAIRRCCDNLLTPSSEKVLGVGGMRTLAAEFADWRRLDEWSWAARFGYQVIIKRGAGGSFFRALYADFLEEAALRVPALARVGLPARMYEIAAGWRALAAILEEQSERDSCAPELFVRSGEALAGLADAEEAFFLDLRALSAADEAWNHVANAVSA